MADGKIQIQSTDSRIYTVTPEVGAIGSVALTLPKEGGVIATDVYMSLPASRLLAGDVSVTNEIVTQGMNTTLYTGNGSTQSVVTGIDMATQWGNSASETFGGLVWGKSRSSGINNELVDSVRGATRHIKSNLTDVELDNGAVVSSLNANGFTVGASILNTNLATYAAWSFQTTHRTSGTTNHGKAYTCHYNPFTGFTIIKYEGSGIAGHEIPHHLGRKLGITVTKNLNTTDSWLIDSIISNCNMRFTSASQITGTLSMYTDNSTILSIGTLSNASTNQYIMYGWANSYYDDKGLLKGNYEVGTYVGTGATGNKVTTKGKPAWVMVKRLNSVGSWAIKDNKRGATNLYADLSAQEDAGILVATFDADGFTISGIDVQANASGGTYLYMVAYDTNANGGGTYYPRTQDTSMLELTDAQLIYSDGYANGTAKNTSEVLSGNTYPVITYSAGYNYVKKTKDGSFSATLYEPKFGEVSATSDYYIDGKWYSSVGTPLGNITYLPIKVLADVGGQIVNSESWKYPEIVSSVMAVDRVEKPKHVTNKEYVDGVTLGVGQTWQEILMSRASGVTYTNTTGKPIALNILAMWAAGTSFNVQIYINGLLMGRTQVTGNTTAFYTGEGNIIVPPNATYLVVASGCTISSWLELR